MLHSSTFAIMFHSISHKGIHWEYETFGSGAEIMLAFHGFGNHSSDFRVFGNSLGRKYKIFSFNLPYHGNSRMDVREGRISVSGKELNELFQQFLHQNDVSKFSLMGYSLGGKIALQLIEFFPARVNSVFLFAPDGIRNNWSNGVVTRTQFGKTVYQRIIHDPTRFLRFVKRLERLKLVHEKLSDFLHISLDTHEKRQQVWDVWMCFRDIKPDIRKIQKIINENNIAIHLFFGKYDRIIPPSIGMSFIKALKNKNSLHIVDMGHVMIREKMNEILLTIISVDDSSTTK
jgi:pimeloyl-ACP methyl ester carboxylesterase